MTINRMMLLHIGYILLGAALPVVDRCCNCGIVCSELAYLNASYITCWTTVASRSLLVKKKLRKEVAYTCVSCTVII